MELDSDLHLETGRTGSSFTSYRDRLYSDRFSQQQQQQLDKSKESNSATAAQQLLATSSSSFYRPSNFTSANSYSYLSSSKALAGSNSAANNKTMTGTALSYSALADSTTAKKEVSESRNLLQQLFEDMRQIEDTVDSIEIPARGRCKVYMAKYGYDPFKQSPNENPDAELAFQAGDYIMVFEELDEDGYFIGELMDGRRGYVPSNWLDRLTGEDLFEFQASTLYKPAGGVAGGDELDSASYPAEFCEAIMNDTLNHSNFQHLLLAPEDYHRMNDYVDLDDVNEVDDECLSDYERAEAEQMRRAVPPPQRLVLERQLNKSILIGWLHPQATKGSIVSYQVYVDGVLKSTVPSGDRTKALLEGVDSLIPHRISVRAIDAAGRQSNDAACTIVIGQRIPFAPSCVKASHITSDSALISWLPCNSNFHHVVAVNSVEVQTLRPGIYKHLINGLSANTLYRVWVRAKPGKILSIDEKNPKKLDSLTTYVDFKTMPKSLPEPPVNVQVEAGPQRRTLLVTWLPLTLNDFGSSNGCAVTGYAVFAGHKKLADIDSPTGDHALLDLADLESLHKKSVTVRTKSGENLSQDSMPCQIPDEYLKSSLGKQVDHLRNQHQHQHQSSSANQRQLHHHQRLSDTNLARHSPLRHSNRYNSEHFNQQQQQAQLQSNPKMSSSSLQQQQQQRNGLLPKSRLGQQTSSTRYSIGRGRQLARSLQNLESDLDSRRSSIPAIEVTRDTDRSGSELINHTESYSEEEFETSMRFRGVRKPAGNSNSRQQQTRYRPRQSHSVEDQVARYNLKRQTPISERDIRYFVALFDYDPSTMSPNPNAAFEELAFKEGSVIKVVGDKGADGFYRGELDNQLGFVPCNVVREITEPHLLLGIAEKSRQQHQLMQTQNYQMQQQHQQPNGVKRMTALYDYDPQENSPNADTESEIPFKMGDVIYVYGKMDTDGFYMGEVERSKQRGLVPSNFLRETPLKSGPQQQQQMLVNQDAFQQQPPTGQFASVQQQQVVGPDGQLMNQFGQQQQVAKMAANVPLARANIRPSLANQRNQQLEQQQQMMQNSAQQNISRPNTLSLVNNQPQNDWNLPRQQQMNAANQQQQQQFNRQQLDNHNLQLVNQQQPQFSNNLMMGQQQQQQPTQIQQNQQAQQQPMINSNNQPIGGVLSNLLSSGKQMIGAGSTPRTPSQPNQAAFPNQMRTMNLVDPSASFAQNQLNDPMQLQHQQQPIGGNNFSAPQMQQPQFNHLMNMNMNRAPMQNQQIGAEEQGGNILNTVKNMFKL